MIENEYYVVQCLSGATESAHTAEGIDQFLGAITTREAYLGSVVTPASCHLPLGDYPRKPSIGWTAHKGNKYIIERDHFRYLALFVWCMRRSMNMIPRYDCDISHATSHRPNGTEVLGGPSVVALTLPPPPTSPIPRRYSVVWPELLA